MCALCAIWTLQWSLYPCVHTYFIQTCYKSPRTTMYSLCLLLLLTVHHADAEHRRKQQQHQQQQQQSYNDRPFQSPSAHSSNTAQSYSTAASSSSYNNSGMMSQTQSNTGAQQQVGVLLATESYSDLMLCEQAQY